MVTVIMQSGSSYQRRPYVKANCVKITREGVLILTDRTGHEVARLTRGWISYEIKQTEDV